MTTSLGGVHVDVTASVASIGPMLADELGKAGRQASREGDKEFGKAGDTAGKSFTARFGAAISGTFRRLLGRTGEEAGEELADGITRGADGKLRDSRGRFVTEGRSAGASFVRGFSVGVGGLGSLLATVFGTLGSITGTVAGGLAKVGAGLAVVSVGAAAATAALGGLAALAPELLQVVGVLGLVPALAVGAAAAIGTLVVGFQGIGDAISAETPEEFNEALKNLSPNAREAAVAVKGFADEARRLRLSVQDALFEGFAETLQRLGNTYLPIAERGMTGLATELSGLGRAFAEVALQPQSIADAGTIFDNIRESIRGLTPGITSFGEAFRDIITVGSSFLPELADRFSELGKRFSEFIANARESGALEQFFRNAIDALRDVFAILGNVGEAFGAVFRAAGASGTSVLGVIRDITQGLADFLNSTAGQEGLSSFFESAAQAAQVLQPILESLFDVFTNTLAPLLADVATTLGPGVVAFINAFGQALDSAAPGILALAEGITSFVLAMAPAATSIGQLAGAIGSTLGQVLTRIGPTLSRVVTLLADNLGEAIQNPALINGLVAIGEAFGDLLSAVAPVLPDLARFGGEVLSGIADAMGPLIDLFVDLIPVLEPVFDAFVFLLGVLEPVFEVIGFIVGSLADLKAILTEVIDFSADALDAVLTLVTGVAVETEFTRAKTIEFATDSELAFERFRDAAGTAGQSMTEFAEGTVGSIGTAVTATQAGAEAMNKAVVEGLRGVARAGFEAFSALTNSARKELEKAKAAAASAMADIAGIIRGADFSAAGAGLIKSLAAGMVSDAALSAVRAAARRAIEAVAAFLPSSPAKEGPFSGRGWTPYRGAALVEGLAAGMLARLALVATASAQLARAADFTLTPGLSTVQGGGGATLLTGPGGGGSSTTITRMMTLHQNVNVPATDPKTFAAITGVHLRAAASKVL